MDTSLIERFGLSARASIATTFANTGYFAVTPEAPYDASLTTRQQAAQVFAKAAKRLTEIGSDKGKMLFVAIMLKDIADVAEFNAEWDEWLSDVEAPSRACFEANLANPAIKVELIIICATESQSQ